MYRQDELMTDVECLERYEDGENPTYLSYEKWKRICDNYQLLVDIGVILLCPEEQKMVGNIGRYQGFYCSETCALCMGYIDEDMGSCGPCPLVHCGVSSSTPGHVWYDFDKFFQCEEYGKAFKYAEDLRDILYDFWKEGR